MTLADPVEWQFTCTTMKCLQERSRLHKGPNGDRQGGSRSLGYSASRWKGATVIQQVITCDICGSQKRQANHWFVAREESGELRINGWNSPHLLSPETKHLCGETCAHKLISQFLMKLVKVETQWPADNSDNGPAAKARIIARADCAAPSASNWQTSPSIHGTPGSPDYVRRERSHPCSGERAS
jgi:hypothetical protein